MTHQQFINLVCRMRSAQKAYFRTRYMSDLELSKTLEAQVDQALRDFSNPQNQLQLFPLGTSS